MKPIDTVSAGPSHPLPVGQDAALNNPLPRDLPPFTSVQEALQKMSLYFKDDPLICRVIDFIRPITAANPAIRIEPYEPDKYAFKGLPLAYSLSNGTVAINNRLSFNQDFYYRTTLHELVHAATRHEINHNQAFREELTDMLKDIRDTLKVPHNEDLITYLHTRNLIDKDKYGATNEHELIAELFTNQRFYESLKAIQHKGNSLSPDNLAKRIFTGIAKYFSKNYRIVHQAKSHIKAENMAEYLMELTESVFKIRMMERAVSQRRMESPLPVGDLNGFLNEFKIQQQQHPNEQSRQTRRQAGT